MVQPGPVSEAARRSRAGGHFSVRLTVRDRRLLTFVADHRLVLASHVQALLEIPQSAAQGRLRALTRAGHLRRRRLFHLQPSCYLVTGRGLAAIGSELPRPRVDLRTYMHDVGAAWLWLAAARGQFGPVSEIISERQLRSRDGLPRVPGLALDDGEDERFGVRLWEVGGAGHEQLHYPDLLLRTSGGKRIALELELSSKSQRRLDKIVSGYGADPRIDAVVYLADRPKIARVVRSAAARAGVSPIVHVQAFAWTPSMQRLALQLAPVSSPVRAPAQARSTEPMR